MSFDEVFGLDLAKKQAKKEIPEAIKKLYEERDRLRAKGDFAASDVIRDKIVDAGYSVSDRPIDHN